MQSCDKNKRQVPRHMRYNVIHRIAFGGIANSGSTPMNAHQRERREFVRSKRQLEVDSLWFRPQRLVSEIEHTGQSYTPATHLQDVLQHVKFRIPNEAEMIDSFIGTLKIQTDYSYKSQHIDISWNKTNEKILLFYVYILNIYLRKKSEESKGSNKYKHYHQNIQIYTYILKKDDIEVQEGKNTTSSLPFRRSKERRASRLETRTSTICDRYVSSTEGDEGREESDRLDFASFIDTCTCVSPTNQKKKKKKKLSIFLYLLV